MHPFVLYDMISLEREREARLAEARWHLHAAVVGRERRRPLARLHHWLRRPASPATLRGATT
jgi:hypothetical protein